MGDGAMMLTHAHTVATHTRHAHTHSRAGRSVHTEHAYMHMRSRSAAHTDAVISSRNSVCKLLCLFNPARSARSEAACQSQRADNMDSILNVCFTGV